MTAQPVSGLFAKAPAPGLKDAVHDAQSVFRAAMNALARPGTVQTLTHIELAPPSPLTPAVAALILTLCDYDTPLWLDADLASNANVINYIRFHTAAPIVSSPSEAAFALASDPKSLPAIASFAAGTAEYPDRSTTVILMVEELAEDGEVTLHGPGIKTQHKFQTAPLPATFWQQMQANSTLYPLGIDVIFATAQQIAGLPRSTQISSQEA